MESRLSEEVFGPLIFQHQQTPLNGPDRGRRDVAVLQRQFLGALTHLDKHGAQVGQIQKGQTLLLGDAEYDVQYPFLRLVQL